MDNTNSLNCDQCGAPLSIPPEFADETMTCPRCQHAVPIVSRVNASEPDAARDEPAVVSGAKMRWGDYALALLLPPIACGIGVAWLVQGFRRAWMTLLIAVPMTLVWFACVMAYIAYYDPGTVWSDAAEVQAGTEGTIEVAPKSGPGARKDGRKRSKPHGKKPGRAKRKSAQ